MVSLAVFCIALAQAADVDASAEAALEAVSVPGTGVTMTPPPGFEAAKDFTGFFYEEAGASIVVTEVPGSYEQVAAGFAPEGPLLQGLEELEREDTTIAERPALIVKVKQQGQHVPFVKLLLVTGTDKKTLVLTAAYPEEFADRMTEAMRSTLLTAKWDPDTAIDHFEALPYRVDTGTLLRVAARSGGAVLLTPDGKLPSGDGTDVILSIAREKSRFKVNERKKFARDRFEGDFEGGAPPIQREEFIQSKNLEGNLIVAELEQGISGRAIVLFQAILFQDNRYFVFDGSTTKELAPAFIPAFEKVVQSFEIKTDQP